jgi:hypothetical protein
MNVKKAIIILLMIGVMTVVAGCARWPEPEPVPPDPEYQLKITKPGPDSYLDSWQGEYYYIKLDDWGCNLYSKDESASPISLNNYSYNGNELKIKFFLSDLGELETSIDVNVVTAYAYSNDSVYDYLDGCINISTTLYTMGEGISSNDLEDDEADFDIIEVFVEITNI